MEISNTNPVVFIDIDGVLNSHVYFMSRKSQKEDERLETDSSATKDDFYLSMIDPVAVECLNDIVQNVPNVEFVLSSTWRRGHHWEHMTDLLQKKGFVGTIKHSTPIHTDQYSVRGNEIEHWLDVNRPRNFFNYVILDDDSDMLLCQKNNFLHVDSYIGLTPNQSYKVCRFLNKETNWLG
jgi:hypothetical protein